MNKNLCFHCGLELNKKKYYVLKINETTNKVCCNGCLAVSTFIIENGFTDYYKNRDDYGNRIDENFLKTNFKMYDDLNNSKKFIKKKNNYLNQITVSIEGISCAACTWLIERYIKNITGIYEISISLLTSKANIKWNPKEINLSDLLKNFIKIGYKAYPYKPKNQEKKFQ